MQYFKRENITGLLAGLVMFIGGTSTALAVGTVSGNPVSNTATVNYTVGTNARSANDTVAFTVDNRVDLTVTGGSAVNVAPGSTDQVLVFTVDNTGNTAQGYAFTIEPAAPTVMTNVRVFIDDPDSGTIGALDGSDPEYIVGGAGTGNFANLFPGGEFAVGATTQAGLDESTGAGRSQVTVFIVADTPAGATDGQTETYDLIARTLDSGTNNPTTESLIGPTAGVDAVFADGTGTHTGAADNDGYHSAEGTYTVASATLSVTKTIINVNDEFNGDGGYSIPGAVVRYQIVISNTGTSATDANSVVFTDPIPAGTKVCFAVVGGGRCTATDLPGITIAGSSITSATLAYDNGTAAFTYAPTADGQGADTVVSDIRYTTVGTLDAGESVTITFGVVIE